MTIDTDRTMEQIKAALTDKRFVDLFWSRVHRGQDDACWPWTRARHTKGYGAVNYRGRQHGAHRMAWMLANGREIPTGMFVCHRCDNPPCCNPAHLWIGTCGDNLRDCAAKGRNILQVDPSRTPVLVKPSCRSIGARNGMAKLTDDGVRAIRRLRADGWRVKDIALFIGLNKNHVGEILRGNKWRHVA